MIGGAAKAERQQLGGGLGGGGGWSKVVPTASEGVVAVVGVGPGLGAAIARRFARERYIVAILARDLGSHLPLPPFQFLHCCLLLCFLGLFILLWSAQRSPNRSSRAHVIWQGRLS